MIPPRPTVMVKVVAVVETIAKMAVAVVAATERTLRLPAMTLQSTRISACLIPHKLVELAPLAG
jgi:hypothetical protein